MFFPKLRQRQLFLLTLFCFFYFSNAQKAGPNQSPKELLKKGDSLVELWQLQKANEKYNLAGAIYLQNKDWENYALAINKSAECDLQADRYEEAFSKAKKSLQILKNNKILGSLQENKAYYIFGYYYDFVEFNFEAAISNYNKALNVKEGAGSVTQTFFAKLYNAIGILNSKNGLYLKAVPYYEKALEISKEVNGEICSEVADIYGNLGYNYQVYGDFEKSILYQEKSIKIDIALNGENNPDVAIAYSNISETYEYLFDLGKAVDYGEKALSIALSKFDENHPFTPEVYQQLSSKYFKLNEPKKAEEYAKRSLQILEKMLGEVHPQLIFPLSTLGSVSDYLGDSKKALRYAQRTLNICLKVYGENHVRTANAYSMLANYVAKEGFVKKSLAHQTRALKIYQNVYNVENHALMANTYEMKGDNHAGILEFSEANKSYKNALQIARQVRPPNGTRESQILNKLASLHIAKGDTKRAREYIDKALETAKTKTSWNFSQDEFLAQQLYVSIYQNKIKLADEIGMESEKIRELHYGIDSIIGAMKYLNTYQTDRITFSEELTRFYNQASLRYLTKVNENKESLLHAFYFIEKGRFRLLKEFLGQRKGVTFSKIPKVIVDLEDSLKRKQSYYKSKLAIATADSAILESHKKNLFLTDRIHDSLLSVIKNQHPTYFDYKYENMVVSPEELKNILRPNELLLQFAFFEQQLHLVVFSKNSQHSYKISTQDVLDLVNRHNNAIREKNTESIKKVGHQLYVLLLQDVLSKSEVNELTIIPDGVLWHLNFELLLTSEVESNNPKKLPFLIKQMSIGYENSATAFSQNRTKESLRVEDCLAFSYSKNSKGFTGEKMALSSLRNTTKDLPGTRKEIKEISKIFNGSYFYGKSAAESAFKKNAEQYGLLHLALHGEVDNENPENSKLFFTKASDDLEDGYLYAHEIFTLNLSAELAVLSACNTGIGPLTSGEGIMSLGSAFQYAGTKSLLLSKWEVSDATTPDIMLYFYENLKKGMTKSRALQQAKLRFLASASGNQAQPYYWASFFVLGDNDPIDFKDKWPWYWILFPLSISILGYFFFRKQKAA